MTPTEELQLLLDLKKKKLLEIEAINIRIRKIITLEVDKVRL